MKLYNSMSRCKEEFVPINEGKVLMYSCGPTVYNYFHIGNARPFIVFDTLRRFLEYIGYEVKFVQNFTDIDDKIIKKANEEGVDFTEITERYIKEYYVDAEGLNIKKATVHPRATENVGEIIEFISGLIEKGYAYESDGDVYFSTLKFKEYGKLSHQPLEDLEAGARIDINDKKKEPMDFALWKKAKEGEPSWESPWGKGRPGWHIECSVMANRYLGKTIDIHSGGKDLIFPHHENEIAQSECRNCAPFANYWLHNGYINIDNQKMSKSLNNFFTVRDVAEKFGYEAIRFFMLQAHYRSPVNYSVALMENASTSLERIYTCCNNLSFIKDSLEDEGAVLPEIESKISEFKANFKAAMEDDLNTASAISFIFEAVKFANVCASENKIVNKASCDALFGAISEMAGVLGFECDKNKEDLSSEIEELIAKRQEARKNKDFATADKIRDDLKQMGITLEDTPNGVKWHKNE